MSPTSPPAPTATRTRIRDAALARFAAHGIGASSLRAVAADAGVAPSHVVHYFGSKAGLRAACDEHVTALVRRTQDDVVATGVGVDPLAALRSNAHGTPVLAYLARALTEPSPQTDALVDHLVEHAVTYLEGLEQQGMVLPATDPRGRAALVTFWSLGSLTMHRHLERVLGVDMTRPDADPEALGAYARAVLELLGPGLLAPAMSAGLRDALTEEAG